jgi:hypothetical protein
MRGKSLQPVTRLEKLLKSMYPHTRPIAEPEIAGRDARLGSEVLLSGDPPDDGVAIILSHRP